LTEGLSTEKLAKAAARLLEKILLITERGTVKLKVVPDWWVVTWLSADLYSSLQQSLAFLCIPHLSQAFFLNNPGAEGLSIQ
jgi:hypothetical protein